MQKAGEQPSKPASEVSKKEFLKRKSKTIPPKINNGVKLFAKQKKAEPKVKNEEIPQEPVEESRRAESPVLKPGRDSPKPPIKKLPQ